MNRSRVCSLSSTGCSFLSALLVAPLLAFASPALARNGSNSPRPVVRGTPSQNPRPVTPINAEGSKGTTTSALQGCEANASFTVATYNVENFWDDVEENSGAVNYDEYKKDGSNWYSDKMYDVKAQHLAEAIRLAGAPDIIAMQEFESANNSSRSLELLKPYVSSMGYKYFALGQQNPNNPVAVTTAVISKFPIVKNERLDFQMTESKLNGTNLQNETVVSMNTSARDPQVVTINVLGQTLRLYTAHWKSRRGGADSGDAMRVAVAELIKSDIDEQRASHPTLDALVMGDFNSYYTERPLQVGMNSTDDKNLMKRDLTSDKMYNLWFELAAADRCSYMYQGQLQCIDHMLTNANLFDGKGIDLVENSFSVVGHNGGEAAQKLVSSDGQTPRRFGVLKNNGRAKFSGNGYSDHLPLVARFKIPSLCSAGR